MYTEVLCVFFFSLWNVEDVHSHYERSNKETSEYQILHDGEWGLKKGNTERRSSFSFISSQTALRQK